MADVLMPDRRQLLSAFAAAVGVGVTAASLTARATTPQRSDWPLWTIRRKGATGRAVVHLFGETPPRARDWHDMRIERLLPDCSVLWTETNQTMRATPQDLVARHGMVAGKPLAMWLTSDDQARLAKAAAFCRVPPESIASFRPWLAGATLQDAYYGAAGQSGQSADRVLGAQATAAGIAVSSEFAAQDDVFAWFGAMSAAQDVQFLRYALDEILAGPAAGERIYADWAASRPARAARVMERMRVTSPALFEKIAVERNHNWLTRFDAMLEAKRPALVVVGLYHLVGPASLLTQLADSGLDVQPN